MALKNIQTHHEIKIILPINAHQNHAYEVNTILLPSAIYGHIYNRINNNCIEYAALMLTANTNSGSASIFNYSLMFRVFSVLIHFTMSFSLFLCCFLFYVLPTAVLFSSLTLTCFNPPSLPLRRSLSLCLFRMLALSSLLDLCRSLFYTAPNVLFYIDLIEMLLQNDECGIFVISTTTFFALQLLVASVSRTHFCILCYFSPPHFSPSLSLPGEISIR